jgi:hypothetical protein
MAKPDLPKRFELHTAINKHDHTTFYTLSPFVGYTHHPFVVDKYRRFVGHSSVNMYRKCL